MGGLGSGAYGYGSKVRKRTVEENYRLDIRDLKGCLDGRDLKMSMNNGKISFRIITKNDQIILLYSADGESIKEYVDIESTKVGFGERLWFCCPECDRKTSRLYIVGKYFRCRVCHELTYLTCQESGNPLDYLALKIGRLQRRLGLDGKDITALPYIKPKNMQQKTWFKLRLLLRHTQWERNRAFLKACGRWGN